MICNISRIKYQTAQLPVIQQIRKNIYLFYGIKHPYIVFYTSEIHLMVSHMKQQSTRSLVGPLSLSKEPIVLI